LPNNYEGLKANKERGGKTERERDGEKGEGDKEESKDIQNESLYFTPSSPTLLSLCSLFPFYVSTLPFPVVQI